MKYKLLHLSHSYSTDAAHLLEKAKIAFKHSLLRQRTSFQAKLVVDAYMSVECSLKSLICSKNSSWPVTDVYKRIRRCKHDLTKLLKEVGDLQLGDKDKEFLKAASNRGVSLRYSLDLFSIVSCELLSHDSVSFTIDEHYVSNFFTIADTLFEKAYLRQKEAFPEDSTMMMTEAQAESLVDELRAIC